MTEPAETPLQHFRVLDARDAELRTSKIHDIYKIIFDIFFILYLTILADKLKIQAIT